MVSSTGTFVSCKDYDDDIDQINKELTDIKSAIADLKTKVEGGKYVTNVAKEGDGIKITWNDNSTSTIETIKGDKGDKTLVTIVDGYWAFDGVKSEYPAKGDKGDKGENGEAAVAGHDAKISSDGYWMVWDAEAKDYKKTEYIAGGATAVAGEHGWTIIVRDKDGQEQSIYIPNSADLVSIEAAKGETGFSYNIYYGILQQAKDWKGAKAVEGKMEAGMYPTLDRDVNVLLNPVGVDATAYTFDFRGSDNKELWGLTFDDMVPYSGEKLTRAVSSASGLWTLPRTIQRVTLENYKDRPDYVTQFKKNDSQSYALAMNAVSKEDASKVVKSQYLYKFAPYNVNSVKELDGYFKKTNYTWNVAHKPNFAASWNNGNTTVTGQTISADSALIYDYWLEIDRDLMPQVKIDKYGLEIVNNKYEFIAKNAAAVDNEIHLKFHYILINGNEGVKDIEATIIEKDIQAESSNIGSIKAKFNAEKLELTGKEALPVDYLNSKYVYASEVLSFDLATKLGANKDQWIDAMYQALKNCRDNAEKAIFLKDNAVLTGGDPINNATYNKGLLDNFVYFDYVDKDGKSCIYNTSKEDNTKLLSRIESITGLKVYFIAGTYKKGRIVNNAPVQDPYYTEDGTANWNWVDNGYALPLDNAFRVQLFTSKEQQTVSALDFSFELTMPDNCPIKRETVGNQTTKWNDKQNELTIYGQKLNDGVYVDMRDAFVGAFEIESVPEQTLDYDYAHAYGPMKPEAEWYKITWKHHNTVADRAMLIGINMLTKMEANTTLGEIANTAAYGEWNTIGYIPNVFAMNKLQPSANRPTYATETVEYDHFGVYPEGLSNFIVKFASKIEDSQKAGLNPELKLKEAATVEAKAVYKDDKVTVDYYTFSVSNATFKMTDVFDNPYYLFDNGTAIRAGLHIKLNEATQGIISRDVEKDYFGLYPVVRVDEKIVSTSLPNIVPLGDNIIPVDVEFIQSDDKAYTTGMTFKIPGGKGQYANDKKFEITFNVTDVFGTVKPFTFYARTVNVAIGNDNKPVGE